VSLSAQATFEVLEIVPMAVVKLCSVDPAERNATLLKIKHATRKTFLKEKRSRMQSWATSNGIGTSVPRVKKA
jgi:hypothetical protein